ncbi:DUF72 domain-containing protein [Anaeromyxobacter oryzisoli]|uniref:DUF72 domain-containing protein n=1 Tax=Anaeromyxobacter oryzisoli TaxID=2925408 RepID=UPI001F562E1A|nr:DUF72 domain-containing protein [Anaeromyxobacter sp. SG63]
MAIRTGTSGWSYAAWKGPFYPAHLPSSRMLAYYAARLSAVEVNNTFYRLPRPGTLAGWRAEVPPGFVFALKAPQRITHMQRLAGADDTVSYFLHGAAELGPALGPMLWQLPPTFKKDLGRLRDFLALLPPGGRHAFEFRHPSWLAEDAFALLADRGAALCVAQDEERETPLVATAPFGYLRLRRPDYDPAALRAWAGRLAAQPWRDAFVFFKHEDGARGPALALAMAELAGAAVAAGAGAAPTGP